MPGELKRSRAGVHLATWPILLLVACQGAEAPRPALTSDAAENNETGRPGPDLGSPRPRLISLSPALTETLFALGAGPEIVGVTRYCDHPPAARQLPAVGGYLDPNPEAILHLRPTLVIVAPSPGNRRPVVALERLGVPVLVVADRNLADIRATIRTLGTELGRTAQAQQLLSDLETRIRLVRERAATRPTRQVLLVYGRRPLICAGASSFGGELLELLGVENSCTGHEPYPLFSMERVLARGPDVILDGAMDALEPGQPAASGDHFWQRWPTIPAVRDRRIFPVASAGLRPGPRLGEALEELERAIWSDAPGGKEVRP